MKKKRCTGIYYGLLGLKRVYFLYVCLKKKRKHKSTRVSEQSNLSGAKTLVFRM